MSDISPKNPADRSTQEPDRTGFTPIEGDRPTTPRRPRAARPNLAASHPTPDLPLVQQTPSAPSDWATTDRVDSLALASFDPSLRYDRATQWQNLPSTKNFSLPLTQLLTTAGMIGVPAAWLYGLQWSGQIFGEMKNKVLFFWWQQPMGIEIPWVPLTGLALASTALNPWIIRSQLHRSGNLKNLSPSQLSQYSAEAYRVLQRGYKESKRSMPRLEIIDTPLPIVLSYGLLPQHQTIAISRSVLTTLKEGEVAALYGLELANLHNWTSPILSATTTLKLWPYLLYWESAKWSEQFLNLANQPQKFKLLGWTWRLTGNTFGLVSATSYGIFAALRWMSFWLARSRTDSADRTVCNLTGNPNGLASALMQLRSRMAEQLNEPEAFLLEALEPLLPIARQESATSPLSAVESWWTLNQFQRPIESRLDRLGKIAKQWNLQPLLATHAKPIGLPSSVVRHWAKPFSWAFYGYLLAWLAWGIAWLGFALGQNQFAFLGSDYSLFIGLTLLGFGMGTWSRFNAFFPDLPLNLSRCDRPRLSTEQQDQQIDETLAEVTALTNPHTVPLKPHLMMIEGKLQGRKGVANWLGQDLWLELPSGEKIKLHFGGSLGPLELLWASLWSRQTLAQSVGKSVMVSGWLRRGGTMWMDVEAARTPFGVLAGGHQIWSIAIGTVAIVVGLFVML